MEIPFDFGAWRNPAGERCPRHGVIHGGLSIHVEAQEGQPTVIRRRYCPFCVIDALDGTCTVFD